MAKELPYFKYFPAEWIKGEITLCSMSAQGLFINICTYYWMKDCNMSLTSVQQRFNNCSTEVEELLSNDILTEDDNGNIIIDFLDEQYSEFEDLSVKRSLAGKRSAEVRSGNKRSTSVKQPLNNKEKRREEKDEEKSKEFKLEVLEFKEQYPVDMLKEFFNYWSEPNKSKTKLRYEMEKTWETSRRLASWANRSKGFKKEEVKGTNMSSQPVPDNIGIRSETATQMPEHLSRKINQIGKQE